MQEICFCGRVGGLADRDLSWSGGRWVLRCPNCGHHDHLDWLAGDARDRVLEEAELRAFEQGRPAAA